MAFLGFVLMITAFIMATKAAKAEVRGLSMMVGLIGASLVLTYGSPSLYGLAVGVMIFLLLWRLVAKLFQEEAERSYGPPHS